MSGTLITYYSHPLHKFMKERKTSDSSNASMTGMSKDLPGKWLVSDEDYPKFLDLLHNYHFENHPPPRALGLVEQPRLNQSKPLLIDLDFQYPESQALARTFTQPQIRKFCSMVFQALEHFFDLSNYELLRLFVCLRSGPYTESTKKIRKDGIHIECPDLSLSNEKQKVIRLWMLSQNIVSECFSGTGYTLTDEKVYDNTSTNKQGWFFYGESKTNVSPYELSEIIAYNPSTKEESTEPITTYTPRELMEMLSVRYNLIPDDNEVRNEREENYKHILRGNIPPTPPQRPAPTPIDPPDFEDPRLQAAREQLGIIERTEGEKDIIRDLVMDCLTEERADTYETWIRVGWCLHNIEPSPEMFQLWMDFSKKSSKFNQTNMNDLRRDWFGRMRKEGDGPRLTELSLRKWARDDNLEEYTRIIDADILEYCRFRVDVTHYHVARLMKKLYGSNYIASINPKSTEWYFYDDRVNMWKHLNQGIQLRKNISFEVAEYIAKAREIVKKELDRRGVDVTEIGKDPTFQKLMKCEQNLYNNGFCNSVMDMASTFFYEEDFQTKLNSNIMLFGCKNGVLELRATTSNRPQPHVLFRDGRPEDFVSFLAGQSGQEVPPISYIPFKDLNEEQLNQVEEIKDFFTKIIPRADLREYVLRLISSCLEGTNREQCYYIFTGGGGNGKSKLMDLCRLTFGDYWSSLPTTVLTRKRPDSGAANPEIMAIKYRRFITMQEPDEKEPLNTSRMKQFSGEDIIEARGLFQDQEKFKVTGKLFMMCNKLPPIYSMDGGTWRRIRVIPFESKFVMPDDEDYKAKKANVYLRDPELDAKLMAWREVFLSWMVDIYEKFYIPTGLEPVPDIVKKTAMEYKESYDSYAKFRNDRIRKVAGEQTEFKHIQRAYSQWLSDSRRSGSRMNPKELQTRLNDEFGEPSDGKTYKHLRVFFDDQDVEDYDKESKQTV
jgi:P4 family phage/plasmid primase-like protien